MRRNVWTGLALLVCVTAGCHEDPRAGKPPKSEPAGWQAALQTGDVRPMADGSAYLIGQSELFYLSNGKLSAVRGLPSNEALVAANLTGLADGSAVLTMRFHEPPLAFWVLKDQARAIERTEEAPSALTQPVDAKGFYFAEASRLQRDIDGGDACSNADKSDDDRPEPDYDD